MDVNVLYLNMLWLTDKQWVCVLGISAILMGFALIFENPPPDSKELLGSCLTFLIGGVLLYRVVKWDEYKKDTVDLIYGCPECGDEYFQEIDDCSDCGVSLQIIDTK